MLIPTFSGNCMNRPEDTPSMSFHVASNANKVSFMVWQEIISVGSF